ncbi:MAG TPA: response regulator [Stellaceae bacterium]|nr:response regulator [Stellaceae bacterium]
MKVLIVDDDRDHAESIADVLDARGNEVEVAGSGEEAVARAGAADFDVVLMDVKLPGISGVDAFFEIKKRRPGARVMLMTGYSLEQVVAQAVENGALGVLHKPFAIGDLLEALQRTKPRSLVLIADDDADFVTSIAAVVASGGYEVRIASNGAEAIEKILAEGADCLILDLRLPVMSGAEVHARLVEQGRSVPTIIVTGADPGEDKDAVARVEAQTQGLLRKPFDPKALLSAIGAAVSG